MKKEQTLPNFVEMEKNILDYWKKNDSFNKLKNKNEGHERFRFLDVQGLVQKLNLISMKLE